jgi:lantibiotic modifying enzyme
MLGAAGSLLACAEIEAVSAGKIPSAFIRELVRQTKLAAKKELRKLSQGESVYLGMAHGIAGLLLALESAEVVFGRALDSSLRGHLIGSLAGESFEIPGSGALWPILSSERDFSIQGWCHGNPGISLSLLSCFAISGRREYWNQAERALRGLKQLPSQRNSFCCGSVATIQSLIEAFRVTGNMAWMKSAIKMEKEIRWETRSRDRSFHNGALGIDYLHQRLSDPALPLLGLGPRSRIS